MYMFLFDDILLLTKVKKAARKVSDILFSTIFFIIVFKNKKVKDFLSNYLYATTFLIWNYLYTISIVISTLFLSYIYIMIIAEADVRHEPRLQSIKGADWWRCVRRSPTAYCAGSFRHSWRQTTGNCWLVLVVDISLLFLYLSKSNH